jgi:hypothetical protein
MSSAGDAITPIMFVRRFRTLSDEDSQQLSPIRDDLHKDWGVLCVEDRDGRRCTH